MFTYPCAAQTLRLICVSLIAVSLTSAVVARERTNPFAQPNYVAATTANPRTANAGPTLKLKAVMPGETNGLANIDGHMLRIGEVYEGFELIEVTRHGARLRRGEQILNLELRPQIASAQRNSP